MADSWTELWSLGSGRARTYCGVAETDGEFAVDVFSGDTCLSSEVFATRSEAVRLAQSLERRYLPPAAPLTQHASHASGMAASA